MVVFRKLDLETAVVFRAIATSCVSLAVLAVPAIAQCPDGTPPPCTRPSRPEARSPRVGVASIRVLASTPVAGTTLKWQDLEKGVPLHVVVEHAVQRVPPGQTPVLAAFVNLTPGAKQAVQRRVLESRLIAARPTQRGLDWVLTTEHVRQQRITVEIHIAFSAASDTNQARGLRLSFDWAASITLEFPVADSSGAASAPPLAQPATGTGQGRVNAVAWVDSMQPPGRATGTESQSALAIKRGGWFLSQFPPACLGLVFGPTKQPMLCFTVASWHRPWRRALFLAAREPFEIPAAAV